MVKINSDVYDYLEEVTDASGGQIDKTMLISSATLDIVKPFRTKRLRDFRLKVISLYLFILPAFAVVAMNGTESVSISLALLLVSFMSIIMMCAHALLKTITDGEEENGLFTLAFDKKAKYLFTKVWVNPHK